MTQIIVYLKWGEVMSWKLLLSTALVGAAVCSPAMAEEVAQVPAANAAAEQAEVADSDDIIVTAERRSVSVQDIPIAISAFGSDSLRDAGVSDPRALNKLVSGLDFRNNAGTGGLAIFIRGVGATPSNGLSDQANAFSVDGVSYSRPVGPDSTFFDLQRVEVLKGPQGTLYGRNATAGAVNVITRQPELGNWGGNASMTLGNYGTYQGEAGLNVPLGDSLAVRVAANVVGHNGYFRDGYNDQDTIAGRIQLRFEPNDSIDLTLAASGSQERGQGTGTIPFGPSSAAGFATRFLGDPWDGPTSPAIDAFVRARGNTLVGGRPLNPTASAARSDGRVHNDIWGVSATLNVDVGPATWTTIAGYRNIDSDNVGYNLYNSQFSLIETNETTVESRFASNGSGPLQWIVGGFYGRESMSNRIWTQSLTGLAPAHPPFPSTTEPDFVYLNLPAIENESWAVFGQATFSVTDRLRVTGGLRYTEDRKTLGAGAFGFVDVPYQTSPFPNVALPSPPFPPGASISGAFAPVSGNAKFDAVTWSAGVEFDATPQNLLYANVRKGYHAGGLIASDSVGPYPTAYAPEELMAYSIGSKNRFFDGALTLNVEAYYWDYTDLQITTVSLVNCSTCAATPVSPAGSTLGQVFLNAGKVHTYGLDVDAIWQITDADRFSLNLLLAKGKYDRFVATSPAGTTIADGRRLAGLADLNFTAGYQHTFKLGNGGAVVAAARSRYVGKRDLGVVSYPGSLQGAYTNSDIEVTYEAPGGIFRATAFVRNIEDNANIASSSSIFPDFVTGTGWGALTPPRTFGITLSADF